MTEPIYKLNDRELLILLYGALKAVEDVRFKNFVIQIEQHLFPPKIFVPAGSEYSFSSKG